MQHVNDLTLANMSAIHHACDRDGYALLTLDEIAQFKSGECPENLFAFINPNIEEYFGQHNPYIDCYHGFYDDVLLAKKYNKPYMVVKIGPINQDKFEYTTIGVNLPSVRYGATTNIWSICIKDLIFVKPIKKETKMQESRPHHASVYEALAQYENAEVRFWNSSTNSQDGLCTNIYLNPRDNYAVFVPFIRKTCQFVWIDSDGDYYISGRNNMEFALTFSTKPGFRIIEESIKEEKAFDYTKPLLISLGVGK